MKLTVLLTALLLITTAAAQSPERLTDELFDALQADPVSCPGIVELSIAVTGEDISFVRCGERVGTRYGVETKVDAFFAETFPNERTLPWQEAGELSSLTGIRVYGFSSYDFLVQVWDIPNGQLLAFYAR